MPVFRYQWQRRGKQFEAAFGWKPTEAIDAEDVAKEMGIGSTLEAMVQKVVGGPVCQRGSNFGDLSIPTKEAQRHRTIRVTVIYEFVVLGRNLRERRPDQGSAQVSRSTHGRKRDRDREGEDDQRRHWKSSRGNDRESGRSKAREDDRRARR